MRGGGSGAGNNKTIFTPPLPSASYLGSWVRMLQCSQSPQCQLKPQNEPQQGISRKSKEMKTEIRRVN